MDETRLDETWAYEEHMVLYHRKSVYSRICGGRYIGVDGSDGSPDLFALAKLQPRAQLPATREHLSTRHHKHRTGQTWCAEHRTDALENVQHRIFLYFRASKKSIEVVS